jgi:CubicO group peptidase (beta-lactamase class C family)
MTVKTKLLGLAALAATATASAPALAEPPADLRARADAIVAAAYPADGPGAAVIITRGGRTIYASGRGLADVEARRPITPATVFRLGSITKQFTAAVILQLVAEGRISLDDPLSRFYPDYPQPGAGATVRQLLQHLSGIQSYTAIPGFMGGEAVRRPHTTDEMIAHFRDLPQVTPPGQAWAYNNSGYVLLGGIIERAPRRVRRSVRLPQVARPPARLVQAQGVHAAQGGGPPGRKLEVDRPLAHPRGEPRGGRPHPGQDQRAGDRVADPRGKALPL